MKRATNPSETVAPRSDEDWEGSFKHGIQSIRLD